MIRTIDKSLQPLKRRIYLMLGRAVLAALSDDKQRQYVQFSALKGEVKDNVERVQEYGFTSHPLPGAQVIFISLSGNRDHPVVISADDPRYRKNDLEPGEVALYTDEGDFIHFKRNKTIEVVTDNLVAKAAETAVVETATATVTASGSVSITSPDVTITASNKVRFDTPTLECTGEIIDLAGNGGITMSSMRSIYNNHVHPENDGGGPTDPPDVEMEE